MPLQLPPVDKLSPEEQREIDWKRRIKTEVKKAKGSLVTRCAIPPIPVLLDVTSPDYKRPPRRAADRSPTANFTVIGGSSSSSDLGRGLSKSASAPDVNPLKKALEYDEGRERHLARTRELHRQNLSFTPANFFAHGTPPKVGGSVSETLGRFWDSMKCKEEELKRQMAEPRPPDNTVEADDAPDVVGEMSTTAHAASSARKPAGGRPAAPGSGGAPVELDRAAILFQKKYSACMFDIRDAICAIILKIPPAPLGTPKTWPPTDAAALKRCVSKEETMVVYKKYNDVLSTYRTSEEGDDDEDTEDHQSLASPKSTGSFQRMVSASSTASVGRDTGIRGRNDSPERSALKSAENLQPITWSMLIIWIEQTVSSSEDRRFKLLCNTMLKQLRFWRRNAASPEEQRKGVYLHTLMRWIWPGLSPTGLARMHMWVANEEIAKIHFETPPLVSDEERKRMEELFKVLDRKKKGYLTAADLAGGENLDMQEQLKNTIDAVTVRVIYGADCKVSLNRFKEIMCEDGYRGHPEATRVLCDNGATGRALKKVVRKVLNYEGWWSEDVAPAEVALRERIDQLELEVIRWRTAAGGGQSARSTQSRPETNNDDKVQGGP